MRQSQPARTLKGSKVRFGDRLFSGLTLGAGIAVLVVLGAIAAFLVWRSVPGLRADSANFLTTRDWFPDAQPARFGILAIAFGTAMTAVLAMAIAVPIGIGVALFIAFYAPRRLAGALGFLVDLLAAVPSIIFGLWGLQVLMPHLTGLQRWLNDNLGFIGLFRNNQGIYTKSLFVASAVLGVMVLPTVSAISREIFLKVPKANVEAALALGATRWESMRLAVFPFSRPGMISAAMLGLGRALGETIAVALILSALNVVNWHVTEPGGNTFAANIALGWNEAGPVGLSALIASGLVLFVVTLLVNMAARWIIWRRAEFSEGT